MTTRNNVVNVSKMEKYIFNVKYLSNFVIKAESFRSDPHKSRTRKLLMPSQAQVCEMRRPPPYQDVQAVSRCPSQMNCGGDHPGSYLECIENPMNKPKLSQPPLQSRHSYWARRGSKIRVFNHLKNNHNFQMIENMMQEMFQQFEEQLNRMTPQLLRAWADTVDQPSKRRSLKSLRQVELLSAFAETPHKCICSITAKQINESATRTRSKTKATRPSPRIWKKN